jgi:hypothetical protein
MKLLPRTEALQRRARLLGVGISNLFHRDDPEQYRLFDSGRKKVEGSVQAMDRIWEKFGPEAIKRATLVGKKE